MSVVDFTQTEFEENWTEVFAPPVPTQRSVAFLGLSFFRPLQTSHTGDVIVSGRQSYMCVVRNGGDTDMRKCDANLRARDSHGGNRRARGRGRGWTREPGILVVVGALVVVVAAITMFACSAKANNNKIAIRLSA